MTFRDLLVMSINNLRRRKLRTVLTVLGVVIGTASIVVMVSLGIGLNEMTVEQISSYGSLTTIEVSSDARWGYNSSDTNTEPNYITDDVIKQLKRLPHVKGVSPMLSIQVLMRQGAYQCYASMIGVSDEYLEEIPLGEGERPSSRDKELRMLMGNMMPIQFSNAKTGKGYWETGEVPDVDFLNKPMFVIFDMDAYYQSRVPSDSENAVKPPKKYMVPTAGMVAGTVDDYNDYSYAAYVNIDLLETQLRRVFKKNPIPGQPTNKKGKALSYLVYDSAQVFVDDMDNVTDVQKVIADMGYQVYSRMDWLEQSKQQSQMVQAVLGGIGAVSLFVAAIGIANTMMMSIYERTKEIGIMKVLGCDMGNIRDMFLIESGFIGFMGGAVGIVLSMVISMVINRFASTQVLTGMEGDLSRIPLWLNLAALAFAVFVGMAAGFMPATRAMKLSPLAAIRNE
ncbi:MAG TPA: ABC transporter permease [Candidatus Cottocaccamicrobium excrementipullorum]|mgnify:CR=1 FL=1|nr:ABC transporter permease [Candidatus Cottocaccamicrobium excrementipullorum]